MLTYGLDACPVSVTHNRTLDFVGIRTVMRIFRTSSLNIVSECQRRFNFKNVSDIVTCRKRAFLHTFVICDNSICQLFQNTASNDLSVLVKFS